MGSSVAWNRAAAAGFLRPHRGPDPVESGLRPRFDAVQWTPQTHRALNVLISKETGDPSHLYEISEEFRDAFAGQVHWMVEQVTNLNNALGKVHQDFYPTPILSAFFEGPMEKEKDIPIEGGATINSSGATIIGFADVADSISAIRKVVFADKELSLAELLEAMAANFEGHGYEQLQKRLMDPKRTPKYGNEDALADETVIWLTELLDKEFGSRKNYRGGHYRVGYWTMTNHAGYARLTKALPSGRKSYENFASGITPVSGVTPCLTQALNSVARLPVQGLSNGVALNLKFTPEEDTGKMLDAFAGYVKGYFDDLGGSRSGGMEIQFNVATHDILVEAAQHPEKHPELLVRVSGYTAYFKDLNPAHAKGDYRPHRIPLVGGQSGALRSVSAAGTGFLRDGRRLPMASILRQFLLLPLSRLFAGAGLILDRLRLAKAQEETTGRSDRHLRRDSAQRHVAVFLRDQRRGLSRTLEERHGGVFPGAVPL